MQATKFFSSLHLLGIPEQFWRLSICGFILSSFFLVLIPSSLVLEGGGVSESLLLEPFFCWAGWLTESVLLDPLSLLAWGGALLDPFSLFPFWLSVRFWWGGTAGSVLLEPFVLSDWCWGAGVAESVVFDRLGSNLVELLSGTGTFLGSWSLDLLWTVALGSKLLPADIGLGDGGTWSRNG